MPEKAMLEIAKYMNEEGKNVLPADFDGVFRFTNWTNNDFTAKWDSKEYTFPANKTSPMIIPSATPQEVQNIRKKFAKDLAVHEFYESKKFGVLNAHTPGGTPALYTDSDLAPLIQKCLNPLPVASAKVSVVPPMSENVFHKDKKGAPITRVLDPEESLVSNSGVVIG